MLLFQKSQEAGAKVSRMLPQLSCDEVIAHTFPQYVGLCLCNLAQCTMSLPAEEGVKEEKEKEEEEEEV